MTTPLPSLEAPRAVEFGWDGRESFSKINPLLQLAWDSVSLGAAKKCPRYYQLSIVEGWRKTRGNSLHFRFGILYHRALEVYDHGKSEGLDHEDAMRKALRDLVHGCMDEQPDGTFKVWDPNEDLSEEKAEKNPKTIYTLFRSVVWYLERFGLNDPIKTIQLANGKPAVELSFRYDSGFRTHTTDEPIMLSGHLDRLGTFTQQPHVVDRKTSGTTLGQYYFDQFNPNNQMTGYALAGRIVSDTPVKGVIIDAVQIAKGFSAFQRGFTNRSEGQLVEWLHDAQYWIGQAELWATQKYWPMNDTSCNDYGGCVFRGICSKDPAVREHYLKTDFHIEKWDPLKVRGDI